jgi:hypothetical protein
MLNPVEGEEQIQIFNEQSSLFRTKKNEEEPKINQETSIPEKKSMVNQKFNF